MKRQDSFPSLRAASRSPWTIAAFSITALLVVLLPTEFGLRDSIETATSWQLRWNSNRPRFVLHVGPPKTGTSTIQHALKQEAIRALLKEDNYVTLGSTHGKMKIPKLKFANATQTRYEFRENVIKKLDAKMTNGPNVLGSNEGLSHISEEECQAWSSLHDSWDFRVVMTYRRLHSYLPSQWNQHFKFLRSTKKMTHTGHGSRIHRGHHDWPGIQGDYEIPTIEEWVKSKFVGPGKRKHPARKSWDLWARCTDNPLKLINMHDNDKYRGDFLTHFVCEGLPDAHTLCTSLLNDNVPIPESTNESVNLDYDMLATSAHQGGLVHERHLRLNVTKAIETYTTEHRLAFPRSCPSSTFMEWLYEWSLESEMWAMHVLQDPGSSSSKIWNPLSRVQQAQFDADWERALPKFCTVDTAQTLQQEVWQKFFAERFAN